MCYLWQWYVAFLEIEDATYCSCMEAEYMALCFGTCEILGLNMTVTKLGYAKQKPISVYEDNQSAIYFSRNSTDNAKTKHIDVIYHFVCEQLVADLLRY